MPGSCSRCINFCSFPFFPLHGFGTIKISSASTPEPFWACNVKTVCRGAVFPYLGHYQPWRFLWQLSETARTWNNDFGTLEALGGSKRLMWQFMKLGGNKASPAANTNTALRLRVWESPVAKCLPTFSVRGPGPEPVSWIMAFIKQTPWSLWGRPESHSLLVTATHVVFPWEDVDVFIHWERRCPYETPFIWNI